MRKPVWWLFSTPGVCKPSPMVTVRHRGMEGGDRGLDGERCLLGLNCMKPLSIYPQVCPSQPDEGGPQHSHLLAARAVLATWDCGHPLTHLEPSPFQALCPTFPILLPIPSQIPRPEPGWPLRGGGGVTRKREGLEGYPMTGVRGVKVAHVPLVGMVMWGQS